MFKYSICSYSTYRPDACRGLTRGLNTASVLIQLPGKGKIINFRLVFKYSICSYSTKSGGTILEDLKEFKYSICSYSTKRTFCQQIRCGGLNTASVLIQLRADITPPVLPMFKYSICSYSTSVSSHIPFLILV